MFFPSLITIVPALGVMTSNLRMLASLSRVNRIRETRKLDGFNPIPPVWGVLNCIAWLLFAFITKDIFVFCSNIFGLVLSTYYMLTLFDARDATQLQKTRIVYILTIGLVLIMTAFCAAVIIVAPGGPIFPIGSDVYAHNIAEDIAGWTAVIVQLCFNFAPLTVLLVVLKEKNSIYFNLPMALSGCVNSILWASYGLLDGNMFIAANSGVSLIIGLIQVVCCLVLKARAPIVEPEPPLTFGVRRQRKSSRAHRCLTVVI